jgi:hypothetical protein
MSTSVFLLAIAALVAANLATRIVVLKGQFGDLPPMPREH